MPRWGWYSWWPGRGWGRGNPFPFCRWFPWLPRWWWATPYVGYYASTIPLGHVFYRPYPYVYPWW